MAIEDVTRTDLEQMFENQTEFILNGANKRFDHVDKRFDRVEDEIAELRATVDRIDRRDSEDIQTLYKEVNLIKQHLGIETPEKVIKV